MCTRSSVPSVIAQVANGSDCESNQLSTRWWNSWVSIERATKTLPSSSHIHYPIASASDSMRATSAEVKGTRPLDIGKHRLVRDKSTCRYGVTVSSRRRAAIKRSNSSFSFGGSDSTAASISARVVTTKAYHINIAANKEFHSYQAPVPTTKILAISHFMDTPMTPAQLAQIMPHEVHDTVNAYLAGKIDQW